MRTFPFGTHGRPRIEPSTGGGDRSVGHKVADFASADALTRRGTRRLARCETAISLVSSFVCTSVKKQQLEILLQQVRPHPHPASELEQYSTPAQIAADVLWFAHVQGDIVGKRVADLGCGTAILGIGAKLLGASEVVAVDIDGAALAVATQNAARLNVTLSFLTMDVRDFAASVDTVLMNPPFGAQNPHADIPFLERAFRAAPRPGIRRALARALAESGRVEDAFHVLERTEPPEAEDDLLRGNILRDAGRLEEAVTAYERVIASGRHLDVAYFERGRALARAHRYRDALRSLDAALGIDGGRSEVWRKHGRVALLIGKPRIALRSLERATELDPDDPDGWELRAKALEALGRSEEALLCRERALGMGTAALG